MITLLLVALAGAVGAALRYLIATRLQDTAATDFPLGTLTVNTLGCLVIGALWIAFSEGRLLPPAWRLPVTVGLLGGFTTFSAFALDTIELAQAGRHARALAYVALSNTLGIAAAAIGAAVTTRILANPN